MDENEQFFVSEMIRHARALPFSDTIKFLTGFLNAMPESHPSVVSLRSIYRALSNSDLQLDLIQLGKQPQPQRRSRRTRAGRS
jgi:hypothetical protein